MSQTDRKDTASSSSTAKALSKDWADVEAFGEAIVKSLGGNRPSGTEPDLLTRWICQEVADRLKAVAKARSKAAEAEAKEEALELILRLWEHRSDWPHGWPPAAARAVFDQITERPHFLRRADRASTGGPWLDDLFQLLDLHAQESQLWLWLGLLEVDVEPTRELTNRASGAQVEPEEDTELLQRFTDAHTAAKAWAESNGARSKKQVRELARKEFNGIRAKRNRLMREALAR